MTWTLLKGMLVLGLFALTFILHSSASFCAEGGLSLQAIFPRLQWQLTSTVFEEPNGKNLREI